MSAGQLLNISRVVELYCPNCGLHQQTKQPAVPIGGGAVTMHQCPRLRMMLAPLLPVGVKAKVELKEREDYVGKEKVRLDPERGRPVMAVNTTRDNGTDAIVFAPTAIGRKS